MVVNMNYIILSKRGIGIFCRHFEGTAIQHCQATWFEDRATERSLPRLFDIVKLLGSKPDGRATVRSPTALLQLGYTVKAFGGTQ